MKTAAVWWVLGADADAPTTTVAAGLLTALRAAGAPAVGVKPIDVGCPYAEDHDLISPDGDRLWEASGRALPPLATAPYRFAHREDPVTAAERSGLRLTLRDLLETLEEAARFGGPVVAVGPAPADTPYVSDGDAWDVARSTDAQVLIVADDKSADRLAELLRRAKDLGLNAIGVGHTHTPVEGAVHIPSADTDPEAVARHLAPTLGPQT